MTTPSSTLHRTASSIVMLWLGMMLASCDQAPHTQTTPPTSKNIVEPIPQVPPVVQEAHPASLLKKTLKIAAGKTHINATVTDVDGRYHSLSILVKDAQQSYKLDSVVVSSPSDLPTHLQKTIGWKGPYLFVRSECGGGNAFRCDVDHIFKRTPSQLRSLGTVGGLHTKDFVSIGPNFRDGFFLDVDSTLEVNKFTAHSIAPYIKLALRDRNNRLTMDRAHTWKINHAQFTESMANAKAAISDQDADSKTNAANGLLYNLAVAKLTNRDSDYRDALALIQKLSGKTHAQQLVKTVASSLTVSSNPHLNRAGND